MAYTVTKLYQANMANKIQIAYDVTADAASGVITTGLSIVESVIFSAASAATAAPKFKRNLSAASAALNGSIMVSSATSGDQFTVIATGH